LAQNRPSWVKDKSSNAYSPDTLAVATHANNPKTCNLQAQSVTYVLTAPGIGERWTPNAYSGAPLNVGVIGSLGFPKTWGSLLRCYLWCHIIAGWVLTTLWVGGLTGLALGTPGRALKLGPGVKHKSLLLTEASPRVVRRIGFYDSLPTLVHARTRISLIQTSSFLSLRWRA
jgi:hypothetical protein